MKGEIRKITVTWTVQCRNCQRVVTKDFLIKNRFENYIYENGWKRGYEDRWKWYCPECVKKFEREIICYYTVIV